MTLDVGPFAAALEFATEKSSKVIGKPAREFFLTALNDIGCATNEAIMIGDDIVSDVGGAQECGIQGVLVRTGKYRSTDENHPKVTPDLIVNNAGAYYFHRLEDGDYSSWDRMINLNIMAYLVIIAEFLTELKVEK